MLVITKREIRSRVANVVIPKNRIVSFDTEMGAIIWKYSNFQIYIDVVLGKDVKEVDWVKLKVKRMKKTSG